MRWLPCSVFVLIWLSLTPSQVQTEILTDRSDLTESPVSVPHRSVQIKAGVVQTWEQTDLTEAAALMRLGAGQG